MQRNNSPELLKKQGIEADNAPDNTYNDPKADNNFILLKSLPAYDMNDNDSDVDGNIFISIMKTHLRQLKVSFVSITFVVLQLLRFVLLIIRIQYTWC